MKPDLSKLLEQALKLAPEARAMLAASLLESLVDDVDEGVEAVWAGEIAKRIHELDSGAVQSIPWDEVRARLDGR